MPYTEWQRKAGSYLFSRPVGHTVPAEDQVGEPCDGKPSRTGSSLDSQIGPTRNSLLTPCSIA
ncbi:conserved hypothetical protein [Ricinus communis]|uniref:Uncharacterized protein n=1 Tax=Ricinus communis TaxID=3988 RepID=B9TM92_RICCO|nr:conserved hypothetical protein [Ricinus communis]